MAGPGRGRVACRCAALEPHRPKSPPLIDGRRRTRHRPSVLRFGSTVAYQRTGRPRSTLTDRRTVGDNDVTSPPPPHGPVLSPSPDLPFPYALPPRDDRPTPLQSVFFGLALPRLFATMTRTADARLPPHPAAEVVRRIAIGAATLVLLLAFAALLGPAPARPVAGTFAVPLPVAAHGSHAASASSTPASTPTSTSTVASTPTSTPTVDGAGAPPRPSWRESPLGRAEHTTSYILLALSYFLLPTIGFLLVCQLRAPPPDTLVFAGSLVSTGGGHASTASAMAGWLASTAGAAAAAACPRRRAVVDAVASATTRHVWPPATDGDASVAPDRECVVCLGTLTEGQDALTVSACGHVFHSGCGMAWLVDGRNNCCPLCRRVVCEGLDAEYRRVGGGLGGAVACR